jgi:hypothetical protein
MERLTFPILVLTPEQQRIVVLDEVFTIAKAKANAEQTLKNAKELLRVICKMFENKGEG